MIEDKFLPEGFRALIRDEIGEKDAEILFPALNGEPVTSIRFNSRKTPETLPFPTGSAVEWCENGLYLDMRPQFTLDPLLHAGAYYVQDASSMVYQTIVKSLVAASPVKVCDLCAAPGGKTTAILNAIPDGSLILANEFTPSRALILKENLCKYGYPDTIITNCDTSRLSVMKGYFNIVAVDAPCSGEGMMRKDETARSQWSEGLVRQCASVQREILQNAVEMLAPGGYLIYSTCTFNTIEDEDNANWVMETFGLEPVDTGLAGKYGIMAHKKGNVPCLRFMPGFTKGEGLFLTVLRKLQEDDEHGRGFRNKAKGKGKKNNKEKCDPHIMNLAKSWIDCNVEIINHDGHLLALTPDTAALLEDIPKGIRIISAGIDVGEIKGKDLIPSHPLAMSVAMAHPFPEVELSTEEAQQFLTRNAINLPGGTPKGYVTVTYQGHPLGFLKNLGNRSNNLYPQEWRIKRLTIND